MAAALTEMTIQEVLAWAGEQAHRLAAGYGLDLKCEKDRQTFLLAQAVKLGEEAGELSGEINGALQFCRASKAGNYRPETMAKEMVDVTICVAILARLFDIDLSAALAEKMVGLEAIILANNRE